MSNGANESNGATDAIDAPARPEMTLPAGAIVPGVDVGQGGAPAGTLCAELARLLGRRLASDGRHETSIAGLTLWRFSHSTEPMHALQEPGVYIVAQGRKQATVGDETYVYDRTRYLAVAMELPVVGRVLEASPDAPYLCLALRVDARALAGLLVETGQPAPRDSHDGRAVFVSAIRAPLLDPLLRLVRLLDAPHDIPVLGPMVLREVHYRLLQGDQPGRLAELALGDGRLRRVAVAVHWIQAHFAETLLIDTLAKRANMSASALHGHFRAATGMTPVQYQKRLRLHEARSLLLSGGTSAEAVAYAVGYASASQFSREYARLFGWPPRRDADRLRDAVSGETPAP